MKVVLFDIDGTLIRSGGAGLRALLLSLTEAFGVPDPQPVPVHGCTDRGICRELFRLNGVELNEPNWDRFQTTYLKHLESELRRAEGRVLPQVVEMLEVLMSRPDVYVGLLTGNVRQGALLKLGHFQLDHYFRNGGFGDHHEDRDDVARLAWQVVTQEIGGEVPKDHLWVVGDTPNDIRCARAIGARVLAVCTGGFDRQRLEACRPDRLADDLSECDDWLASFA